ncbi:MAG: hypothetical protein PHE17_17900 [Thiothrix sp.]|uniref:hypothetical protein n=1 Tax=Thiothrix sp. TaxID=1032 RepID=UPI0026265CFD|nr:hypothetical protein [Thiothrix sp.]MDD5394894.1 hypothetical protein [Thiothrix sp.]
MDVLGTKKIAELQQQIKHLEQKINDLKDALGKAKKEAVIAAAVCHHRCGRTDAVRADGANLKKVGVAAVRTAQPPLPS